METFRHLGASIRRIRELRGLDQNELARESGVGKSQISKYENGKELPKLESLGKILAVLKISPQAFFYIMATFDDQAAKIDEPDLGMPHELQRAGAEIATALKSIAGSFGDLTTLLGDWLDPQKH